jgi:hypothetical protein
MQDQAGSERKEERGCMLRFVRKPLLPMVDPLVDAAFRLRIRPESARRPNREGRFKFNASGRLPRSMVFNFSHIVLIFKIVLFLWKNLLQFRKL